MDEVDVAPPSLAKLTDRFLAYLLDTVPFGVGYHASSIYLISLSDRLPDEPASRMKLTCAWVGLYVAYHAVSNMTGGTIGKALMGLRVAGPDGERPSPVRSVARAVGLLLSTPLNLGFLWAFVDRDSRTWHDLLAGTRVVEVRPKSPSESLVTALASLVTLVGLAVVSVWAQGLKPTPADVEAIARAQQGLLVLAEVQERYKAERGAYTSSLADLAVASGDVAQFKAAMGQLFDPERFVLAASDSRYSISARARDRRRTTVTLNGPVGSAPAP
ncbi:MAG: RDD family protein [Elusimicrobia bacterium]|nr:RDD family protein [Elusimicrobiota bacterium]